VTDAVLFDLDGTLLEYDRAASAVLAAAFERVGVEPFFTTEEYTDHFQDHLPADSGADLRERCFRAVAREKGQDPELAADVAAAYTAERDPGNVRVFEGAYDVLDAFADEYRLGVVTNGPPDIQGAKLDATNLRERFEAVVFAGAEAPAKPATEPFERALAALDATPDRAVYVGNSLDHDVAGALAAGLTAVWLPATDDDPEPTPDYAVPTLSDLLDPPWA
jgi:FMN phosphatase YigB (HAD superfamily)